MESIRSLFLSTSTRSAMPEMTYAPPISTPLNPQTSASAPSPEYSLSQHSNQSSDMSTSSSTAQYADLQATAPPSYDASQSIGTSLTPPADAFTTQPRSSYDNMVYAQETSLLNQQTPDVLDDSNQSQPRYLPQFPDTAWLCCWAGGGYGHTNSCGNCDGSDGCEGADACDCGACDNCNCDCACAC